MNQQPLDLDACAQEPIRIPGGIQPHGALLVINSETLDLLQSSQGADAMLGVDLSAPSLPLLLDREGEIARWVRSDIPTLLRTLDLPGGRFQVVGHRTAQGTILEFEIGLADESAMVESLYPRLQRLADSVANHENLRELGRLVADEVRSMTGFNRVMIYDFDKDWHGTVLAESNDGALPSYLDLRFPASDIPAQARELYRLNPLRIIPDANYRPVPLEPMLSPVDSKPLDLSFAGLRSVSPVHLEYMRNMGTLASMSVSIVVDDKLWGLISCHNATPKRVSAQVRSACNFAAKILSLQVGSVQRGAHAAQRIKLKHHETELVAHLSRAPDMIKGLGERAPLWMGLAGAGGAAVVVEDAIETVGEAPSHPELRKLAQWLGENRSGDLFVTDALSKLLPEASTYAYCASGVIAVPISQLRSSFVMWFRPEVVRTVTWGGNPSKPVSVEAGRLHPRSSFAQWKELLKECALPWTQAEIQSAEDFRNALINFVLRRAEEKAEMTEELQRSNQELESFSYSVSHDLRAPFRHIVGYAELLTEREAGLDDKSRHYLSNIKDAALSAGRLVDDLLSFSQLGRASIEKTKIDVRKLVEEIRRSMEPDMDGRVIEWVIGDLPPAWGDASLLRQALSNLIENALKYTRESDISRISISGQVENNMTVFSIIDNGVGFDMTYVDKLFGVFQRLHRAEDFEGTGIGLALTKRVLDRHGGWIRAQGVLNEGATFTFGLPTRQSEVK